MIFYDTVTTDFYYTTNRLGSTLLYEISKEDSSLQHIIHPPQLIKHVNDKRTNNRIIFPFRDPIARFKSGLNVNMFNRTTLDFKFEGIHPTSLWHYKYMLLSLDNILADNTSVLSYIYRRPFHLFDKHTDHWLMIPLIYMVYNYNVKLLPLYDLSKVLKDRFPSSAELILKRERADSFNTPLPKYEKIWQVYKEVFIDHEPLGYENIPNESKITWQKWMASEKEIFDMIMKYLNTNNLNHGAHKMVNKILNTGQYLHDYRSPISLQCYYTIQQLEFYGTNPKCANWANKFMTIKESIHNSVYNNLPFKE